MGATASHSSLPPPRTAATLHTSRSQGKNVPLTNNLLQRLFERFPPPPLPFLSSSLMADTMKGARGSWCSGDTSKTKISNQNVYSCLWGRRRSKSADPWRLPFSSLRGQWMTAWRPRTERYGSKEERTGVTGSQKTLAVAHGRPPDGRGIGKRAGGAYSPVNAK